jgi:hypothetical protein
MGNCTCCSYPNGCITLGPSLLIFPAVSQRISPSNIFFVCLTFFMVTNFLSTSFFSYVHIQNHDIHTTKQLLLTFWGVFSCNYVNYTTQKANEITAIGLFWKSVPSFTYEDATTGGGDTYFISTCTPYNWFGEEIIQYDGPFRAARGLGLIAVLFGCVMTVVVWIIASCIPISKMGWRVIGLILGVIGVFQLFTLLLLSSKVCSSSCTNLGSGGITSIVSGVLWIVSGILCFLVGGPVENEEEQIIQVTAAAREYQQLIMHIQNHNH